MLMQESVTRFLTIDDDQSVHASTLAQANEGDGCIEFPVGIDLQAARGEGCGSITSKAMIHDGNCSRFLRNERRASVGRTVCSVSQQKTHDADPPDDLFKTPSILAAKRVRRKGWEEVDIKREREREEESGSSARVHAKRWRERGREGAAGLLVREGKEK